MSTERASRNVEQRPMTSRGTRYWSSGSIPLIGPDVLGGIIAKASDLSIVISEDGRVLSVLVNPDHPSFGRLDKWEGHNIREFLTIESVPKLDTQLTRFMQGDEGQNRIELNHTDEAELEFPIRYSFHTIGPDGAILMLGRDLRPIAEMQQQLVKTQLALERDYEAQREFDTRFRVLMEAGREAFVFVNQSTGRIAEVNAVAATMLDDTIENLTGSPFSARFDGRRKGDLVASLAANALGDPPHSITVSTRGRRSVVLHPTAFRAAGERMLLCRITSEGEDEAPTDDLTENISALYQEGTDSIVFTDEFGIMKAANDSFLGLVDSAHLSAVRSRAFSDFLARGAVDLKVLIENARRTGQMRHYATRLVSEYGGQVPVEISATWLNDRAHPVVAFVIRDASRADAMRKASGTMSDDGVASVMELVGSASLKEIVSETTDVVEKMCIETAVELTNNNRVAAAEMLGLSRQSLYVKLRKYGLIDRED